MPSDVKKCQGILNSGVWSMGWPAPADSKSAIIKAGKRIRKGEETQDDIDILNRWRAAHGYIINTFQANLRLRTRGLNIPVGQRLKRASTIIDKLKQGRSLDLWSMHDIAGMRVIFNTINDLNDFRQSFHSTKAKHRLVNEKDKYDYISTPKKSGYRGIHDVYSYEAFAKGGTPWNGLLIEIQYRTVVQHAWSTAVELSDALTANRTKFGQGSDENTKFFQISSELLARKYEGKNSYLPDYSKDDLISEWKDIEQKARLFDQLKKVWRQDSGGRLEGFVLLIVPDRGDLQIENRRSYKDAITRLLQLETERPEWDVVLVRGDDESLRSTFRNYFRNATEFISLMEGALE